MRFDEDWAREISLDGRIEFELTRYSFDSDACRLSAQLRVRDTDRDNASKTLLYHPATLAEIPRTRLQAFTAVRHHLLSLFDHEIRERLQWRGRYAYDPHAKLREAWLGRYVDCTSIYERFGWMKGSR